MLARGKRFHGYEKLFGTHGTGSRSLDTLADFITQGIHHLPLSSLLSFSNPSRLTAVPTCNMVEVLDWTDYTMDRLPPKNEI